MPAARSVLHTVFDPTLPIWCTSMGRGRARATSFSEYINFLRLKCIGSEWVFSAYSPPLDELFQREVVSLRTLPSRVSFLGQSLTS